MVDYVRYWTDRAETPAKQILGFGKRRPPLVEKGLHGCVPDLLHPVLCKLAILLAHFAPAALQLKDLDHVIAGIEHLAGAGFFDQC